MEDPVLKDYIIGDIVREAEQKGLIIEKVFVENFIDNFINQYERLPKKNEIKPIVSSYLKMLEKQAPVSKIKHESITLKSSSNVIDPVIKNFIQKKNLINSIKNDGLFTHSGEILTIPKPIRRRLCPICEDENWYKIHESIDKNDIISHFPRVYGKIYTCSGCGCIWKEK
ncbi:MAG: hypothetical protein HWN80_03305 [Candidatus Lokiarchaeota archaeon]|nr:hypothetical protein [Candidatus Lokiarchaeota archaeon]